jgi:dipeptidyl aminopeptidase/acylaminoacyl peptidase
MPYDIERYLNIRSAYGASFGPEGERVSFLMDTTGTPQVWSVDGAGRWPHQRTFEDERVGFATWSPERDELVYGMDRGGNERMQFFRLSGDGSEEVALTARPDAKHRWGGWSHDGERFAFASNRRDESVFDLYVQGRDETGNDATLVHEGDGWLSVGGWSPDDDRLIVSQAYSNYDQDLSVLDLDSGELEHLTPHEGNVRYTSASWGPEGEALYLCTDEDSDTLYLARLDLDTGDIETVVDGGDWSIDGVSLDDETGRLVYSRNVDGYTELIVGELAGETEVEEFPSPDLPGGVAGGVSWGPDAERFALTATGAAVNTNVYLVETETGATERWSYAATAGIPESSFREPELVHVESFDGLEVPGFLTLPDGASADDPVPVIVSIHGGPEAQRRPSFNPVKQYYLNRGYGYFEPNVRGSAGYGKAYSHLDDVRKRMDSVADVEACVDWLADHDAVDADRLVAMGGSYGGFMVLASLVESPERWAAGVDIVGIANFVTFLENTGEWRRELREAEYGSLAEDREFLQSISPTENVEAIRSPLFVIHGENDPRVPVGEAHQIVEGAREQGVTVRELVFEDEGHGLSKLENKVEAHTAVADFLDEHV